MPRLGIGCARRELASVDHTEARNALALGTLTRTRPPTARPYLPPRITVTFGGAAVLDPGAIELRQGDGSLVDASVSVSLIGGK